MIAARRHSRWRWSPYSSGLVFFLVASSAAGQASNLADENLGRLLELTPRDYRTNVTTISGDELRQTGARFLTDAFRSLAGLEVLRTTSTESNVSVRGFNDTASATQGIMGLLDGRRMYNEFFGNVLWDTVPVSIHDIDRIEVIRGPSAPSYGSDGMHGLINIVTRSPLDYTEDHLSATFSVGDYRSVVGALTYVKRDAETGLKVRLGWDDIQSYEDRSQNAKGQGHLELRLAREFRPRERFEVSAGLSDQRIVSRFPLLLNSIEATFDSEIEDSFIKANYEYEGIRAQLSWSSFGAKPVPDRFYTPFRVDLDVVDFDVQYTSHPLDPHVFTVGSGYRVSSFETEKQDISNGRHQVDLTWLFVQDDWRVDETNLQLTFGARFDYHSKTHGRFSPRLAAVYEVAEGHHIRGSFGVGHRMPSLRELWFDMPVSDPSLAFPAVVLGNEKLDPERMRSIEIGYFGALALDEKLTAALDPEDEEIKIGVTIYYNQVDDEISFPVDPTVTPPPLVVRPQNSFDVETYGLEIDGKWKIRKSLELFGNYSLNYRRDRDTSLVGPQPDRDHRAPRNKANIGLRSTGQDARFDWSIWANFFGETEWNGTELDSYILVNGQVSWRPWSAKDFDVFLQGMNILDEQHKEHPEGDEHGVHLMAGVRVIW